MPKQDAKERAAQARLQAGATDALGELETYAALVWKKDAANLSKEDWAAIAAAAGQLQRRARQLAGLGRGG